MPVRCYAEGIMPRLNHSLLLLAPLLLAATAFADSDKGRAAGAEVYKSFGCAQCHNADLSGSEKGPNLQGVGKRLHQFDITQQIHNGGGGMPAFADVIDEQQMIHLVEFLHAQRKGPKVRKQFRSLRNPDTPVTPVPLPDKEN